PKGIEEIDNEEGKVRYERPESVDPITKSARNEKQVEPVPEREERQIFKDPYAVLAEIATDSGVLQNRSAKGEGGSSQAGPSTGAEGGDAYRDPFDPNYWSTHVEDEIFPLTNSPAVPPPSQEPSVQVARTRAEAEAQQAALEKRMAAGDSKAAADQPEAAMPPVTAETAAPAKEEKVPDAAQVESARALAAEIAKKTGAISDAKAPDITVVAKDDGLMIQLTDKVDYGMFAIGSAKPDKRVIQVIDEIAKIIAGRKGEVVISGHTDGRPFKSDTYDNWRLSSARAQMAYYMLTRKGLDPKRVLRVEGYADRDPKVASDPYAAQNRRIDIFLRTGSR
ncbi:MAG: MotB family protein, partial [Phyllobacterium sp.]|uniref:MotB family protein n=1 Tax=Phyllobacterium sp. TaxID=1871046 RepID=UPI0030EFB8D5